MQLRGADAGELLAQVAADCAQQLDKRPGSRSSGCLATRSVPLDARSQIPSTLPVVVAVLRNFLHRHIRLDSLGGQKP